MHKQRDQNVYTNGYWMKWLEVSGGRMYHGEFHLFNIFNHMCSIDFE